MTTRINVEGYEYLHETGSTSLEFTKYTGSDVNVITPTIENYTLAKFTINPNPEDAIVTLTAAGYTQEGNSITVEAGTRVNWSVSRTGFTSQSGQVVVNSNTDLPVVLVPINYKLTIIPTPNDAVVTLTAAGYTQQSNSITVPYGTDVTCTVSKVAYNTYRAVKTVTQQEDLPITLIRAGDVAKVVNYGTAVICFFVKTNRIFDLGYTKDAKDAAFDYGSVTAAAQEKFDCGGVNG